MSAFADLASTFQLFGAALTQINQLKIVSATLKTPNSNSTSICEEINVKQTKLTTLLNDLEANLSSKSVRKRIAARKRRLKRRHFRRSIEENFEEEKSSVGDDFDENLAQLKSLDRRRSKLHAEMKRLEKLSELRELRKRLGKGSSTAVDDENFHLELEKLQQPLQTQLDSISAQIYAVQLAIAEEKVVMTVQFDAYKTSVTKLLFGDRIVPLSGGDLRQNRADWDVYKCPSSVVMSSPLPFGWNLPQFTTEEWLRANKS